MTELLQEVFGWFGYLERGAVQLQVVLVLLPLLALVLARRQLRRPSLRPLLFPLALAGMALAAPSWPCWGCPTAWPCSC